MTYNNESKTQHAITLSDYCTIDYFTPSLAFVANGWTYNNVPVNQVRND